jgi:hypothetical protein
MTYEVHVCRACGEPITDPDGAVYMGHEDGNSGPGWDVWAHRDHIAQAAELDPTYVRIVARMLILRAFEADL